MQQVTSTSAYNKLQPVTPISLTSSKPPCFGCIQLALGGSVSPSLSASGLTREGGGKTIALPMLDNHSDCSRVVQHALVLGSGDSVRLDRTVPPVSFPGEEATAKYY